MHYNRFRYYDPTCGRFINQDPVGLAGGNNNYLYVPNPVGWVDPFGLACKEFSDSSKLQEHFEKHGGEFKAESKEEYLQIAQDVIDNGTKVEYQYKGEARTGYIQLMGNNSKGKSKFAFVGTNNDGYITTLHTKSGKDVWKTLNGNALDKMIRPVK